MKRFIALIAAFALLLAAAATWAQASDTLVYGTTDKVTDMDPASAYDFHTWEIFQNISSGLLAYTPGTTDIVPALAKSYTVNKAGDEYTFKLREGVKFSNGNPFNAQAVKWNIDRVAALKGDPAALVTNYVKSVEVVDDYTVRFHLTGPVAFFNSLVATPTYFPMDPTVYPVDKIVKDVGELNGGEIAALGPYRLTSFKRDEEAVFEANPNYYGKQPPIKKIIIRYFADATTMRLALEKGEIDLAFKSMNPSDIADLIKSGKYNAVKVPGPQIRYLCFETSESVFKNKKLRQAVAALINRPEINQKVYLGENAPLYSMIPMGMSYHRDDFKERVGRRQRCGSNEDPESPRVYQGQTLRVRPVVHAQPLRRHGSEHGGGPAGAASKDAAREGEHQVGRVGNLQAAVGPEADGVVPPGMVPGLHRP